MIAKKSLPPIFIAFIGFILYGACGFFSLYIEAANSVKMLAVLVFIYAFIKAPKSLPKGSSNSLITVFVYYTIFILIRGAFLGSFPVGSGREITSIYGIIRNFIVYEHSALSFFIILFILVPFDIREFRFYRYMALFCTFICLINIYLYKDDLFSFHTFGMTSIIDPDGEYLSIRHLIRFCFIGMGAILIFIYSIRDFKRNWIDYLTILVIVLYGMSQVAGGGRGGAITSFLYITFMLYFMLKNTSPRGWSLVISKMLVFAVAIVIIYGTYYLIFETDASDFLFSRLFESGEFSDELKESTREHFVNNLVTDLNNHPWAWFIGKGVNGAYVVNGGLRGTIEWGYWHLILKGGIFYLILYVYLLLKTFYLGFFKSNNVFSKAMAILCFMCAYSLIPFGLPMVTLDFVLVWHYVRLINTKQVRDMTDAEIIGYLQNKKS